MAPSVPAKPVEPVAPFTEPTLLTSTWLLGGGTAEADWATTNRAVAATTEAGPENNISMAVAVAFLACMGRGFFTWELLD